MTAQISKSEQDERGLLPYPVIIAATKGDPEAMNIVVQHYESYIASLSMRKLRDERGNIYWGIDEDIRCLLYTSDAADDLTRVDLGGRRIIKKKIF